MQEHKKLNLLPLSVKNKYANKYLIYAASLICGICILALAVQYINIYILNYDIQKIEKANAKYNEEKAKIESLQNTINEHKSFLQDYENGGFPFSLFMHDVELYKPNTVSIISIDSRDRLTNEGVAETDKTLSKDEATKEQKEKTKENQENEPAKETSPTKLEYAKDLSGGEIVIRGYGQNSQDISTFIYNISKLNYIASVKITAIEQHTLDDKEESIFEITVIGGATK